jgi:hypothetical protein
MSSYMPKTIDPVALQIINIAKAQALRSMNQQIDAIPLGIDLKTRTALIREILANAQHEFETTVIQWTQTAT